MRVQQLWSAVLAVLLSCTLVISLTPTMPVATAATTNNNAETSQLEKPEASNSSSNSNETQNEAAETDSTTETSNQSAQNEASESDMAESSAENTSDKQKTDPDKIKTENIVNTTISAAQKVYAQTTCSLTFNSGEGKFAGDVAQKTATYSNLDPVVLEDSGSQRVHSANITDSGGYSGNYQNNVHLRKVITSKYKTTFHVKLKYGLDTTGDAVYVFNRAYYGEFTEAPFEGGQIKTFTGGLSSARTVEFDVANTDALTFAFISNETLTYWGFWAEVTWDYGPVEAYSFTIDDSPDYLEPSKDDYDFIGWQDDIGHIYRAGDTVYSTVGDLTALYSKKNRGHAYAVLGNDGTLTFLRSEHSYDNDTVYDAVEDLYGTLYSGRVFADIETLEIVNRLTVPWYQYRDSITTVACAQSQYIFPHSMTYWFSNCRSLRVLDLSGLNTSGVVSMQDMLSQSPKIRRINFGGYFSFTNGYINEPSDIGLADEYTWSLESNDSIHRSASELISGWDAQTDAGWWKYDISFAYASLSASSGGTLTFLRSSEEGVVSDNTFTQTITDIDGTTWTGKLFTGFDTATSFSQSPWYSNRSGIVKVQTLYGQTIKPKSCANWFSGFSNLTSVELPDMDTSDVVSFNYMFNSCSALEELDLSSFYTPSCKDFSGMFFYMSKLSRLNIENFDTSHFTVSGSSVFYGCYKLAEIKIGANYAFTPEGMNTALLTFPTPSSSYITGTDGLWHNDDGLALSPSQLAAAYNPATMAGWWYALLPNDAPNTCAIIITADADTDPSYSGDIGDLVFFLTQADLSSVSNGTETTVTDKYGATWHGNIYKNVSSTGSSNPPWYSAASSINKAYVAPNTVIMPKSMYRWFASCVNLEEADLSGIDPSSCTTGSSLFNGSTSLLRIKLGNRCDPSKIPGFTSDLPTGKDEWNYPSTGKRYTVSELASHWATDELYDWLTAFGTAYASLSEDGVLTLFRSGYSYSQTTDYSFCAVDTAGNEHVGRLYSVYEIGSSSTQPWAQSGRDLIKKARIAPGQTIRPDSLYQFFYGCGEMIECDLRGMDTTRCGRNGGESGYLHIFFGCHKLEVIDISTFDNYSGSIQDINGICTGANPSLRAVCLSKKLVVTQPSTSEYRGFMYAPTTSAFPTSDGKYYNADGVGMTPQEMYDTWDGSTMGGWWYATADLAKKGNAYAVLSDDGTLSMFRSAQAYSDGVVSDVVDNDGNSYSGRLFSAFETSSFSSVNDVPWHSYMGDIKEFRIAADQKISPASCAHWFEGANNLTDVDLSGLSLFSCSTLESMFEGCSSLQDIDMSVVSVKNVANMNSLFKDCSQLTSIDTSFWKTTFLVSTQNMFSGCASLQKLDINAFDMANVTSATNMFDDCSALAQVTLGDKWAFNGGAILPTPSVAGASGVWFDNDGQGKTPADLANSWDADTMAGTYWALPSDVVSPSLGTAYAVLTDDGVLTFIRSSETHQDKTVGDIIDILGNTYHGTIYSNIESEGTSIYTNQPWRVKSDEIKYARSRADQVISPLNMCYWFYKCSNLEQVDLSGFNTSNTVDFGYTFGDCTFTPEIATNKLDTSSATRLSGMFSNCLHLKSIDVSKFKTSNVEEMDGVFKNCSNVTVIDVSEWDTSKATTTSNMFYKCSTITTLDVAGFQTSNVSDMSYMFSGCSKVPVIDVSGFDTSSVTEIKGLFDSCASLTHIDINHFQTSNVSDFSSLFNGCSSAVSIECNNIDVTNMANIGAWYTFQNCKSLKTLDIGSWHNTKTTSSALYYTFCGCTSLETLNIENLVQQKQNYGSTNHVFDSCRSLSAVKLGANFTFTNHNASVLMSLPSGLGTWLHESGNWEYSSDQLAALYDGSQMSGWWHVTGGIYAILITEDHTSDPDLVGDVGDLTLFKSTTGYTSGDECLTVDVDGVKRKGWVYSGIESKSGNSYQFWGGQASSIKKVLFNTYNISPTTCSSWFGSASNLTYVDLSAVDTSNATSFDSMFSGCSSLEVLDLGMLDTRRATMLSNMFSNCTKLKAIKLGPKWSFDGVSTSSTYKATLPSPQTYYIPQTDRSWHDNKGNSYTASDLANNWDAATMSGWYWAVPSEVVASQSGNAYALLRDDGTLEMLRSTQSYSAGYVDGVTDIYGSKHSGIVYPGIESISPTSEGDVPWSSAKSSIRSVMVCDFAISPTSCSYWFSGCTNLTKLDLSSLNTTQSTAMTNMFDDQCVNISQVTLGSNFDFKGLGSIANAAVLPTPSNEHIAKADGKWYKDFTVNYTPAELRDNWNGASMSGTWYASSDLIAYATAGTAYAIFITLDDDDNPAYSGKKNELVIFRSTESYTNGAEVETTDVFGTKRYGVVFTGIETYSKPNWTAYTSLVTKVYVAAGQKITPPYSIAGYFANFSALTEADLTGFDTSQCTQLQRLFDNCSNLTRFRLGKFFDIDGKNIESYSQRFDYYSFVAFHDVFYYEETGVDYTPAKIISQWPHEDLSGWFSFDGIAYAVLITKDSSEDPQYAGEVGDVVFFRSFEDYTAIADGSEIETEDVDGVKRYGRIFNKVEKDPSYYAGRNWGSNAYRDTVLRAYVAPDQNIFAANIQSWFAYCHNLVSVDLSGLYSSSSIDYIFGNCTSLQVVDLSDLTVTDSSLSGGSSSPFYGATQISAIKLGKNWKFKSSSTSRTYTLPSNLGSWRHESGAYDYTAAELTENYDSATMYGWWRVCSAYAVLVTKGHDTDPQYTGEAGDLVLCRSSDLLRDETQENSIIDVNGNKYFGYVYYGLEADTAADRHLWTAQKSNIKKAYVSPGSVIKPYYMESWFASCPQLTSIDLEGIDTSRTSNLRGLIQYSTSIERIRFGSRFNPRGNNITSSYSLNIYWEDTLHAVMEYESTGVYYGVTDIISDWEKDQLTGWFAWKGAAYMSADSNNTLTFFRSKNNYNGTGGTETDAMDIEGNTWSGRLYKVPETTGQAVWHNNWSFTSSILKVRVAPNQTISPQSCYEWFFGFSKLTDCDLNGLDTHRTTSFMNMFQSCTVLETVDLSMLDVSHVTSFTRMFQNDSALTYVDTTGWDTSSATSMENMFYGNSALKSIDISHFNVSKLSTTTGMFCSCTNLETINMPNNRAESLTMTNSMFGGCKKLTTLDVSMLNMANVTNMSDMFSGCSALESIDNTGWSVLSVQTLFSIFNDCSSLASVDVSMFDTSHVLDFSRCFYGCSALTSLDLGNWDTSAATSLENMFERDTSLSSIYLGENFEFAGAKLAQYSQRAELPKYNWKKRSNDMVTGSQWLSLNWDGASMSGWWDKVVSGETFAVLKTNGEMIFIKSNADPKDFTSSSSTTEIEDVSGTRISGYVYPIEFDNTSEANCPWDDKRSRIKSVSVAEGQGVVLGNGSYLFANCPALTSVDLSGADASRMHDANQMFAGSTALSQVILPENMNALTNTYAMFSGCSDLEELDLTSIDTSNCTNMMHMLDETQNLARVTFGNTWDPAGDDISAIEQKATLPIDNPVYIDSWIKEDDPQVKLNSTELCENWSASSMATTWIRETGYVMPEPTGAILGTFGGLSLVALLSSGAIVIGLRNRRKQKVAAVASKLK